MIPNIHEFVRVLNQRPIVKAPVIAEFHKSRSLAEEAFGPPEQIGNLLFWNFLRSDCLPGPTITVSTIDPERIRVRAGKCGPPFFSWVTDRLGEISSGERFPLFVAGGNVMRSERISL